MARRKPRWLAPNLWRANNAASYVRDGRDLWTIDHEVDQTSTKTIQLPTSLHAMKVSDTNLFVPYGACDQDRYGRWCNGGLEVYDISTATNPTFSWELDFFGIADNVYSEARFAYLEVELCTMDPYNPCELAIYLVDLPERRIVGSFDLDHFTGGVAFSELNYIYC